MPLNSAVNTKGSQEYYHSCSLCFLCNSLTHTFTLINPLTLAGCLILVYLIVSERLFQDLKLFSNVKLINSSHFSFNQQMKIK